MELKELIEMRELLREMGWVAEPVLTDSGELVTNWRAPGAPPGTGMPEDTVSSMLECQLQA